MDDAQGTLDPTLRISSSLEVEVVRAFLRSLERLEPDAVASLVAEDFELKHPGLPTIRGRRTFRHGFGLLASLLNEFQMVELHIAGDGPLVLAERREFVKTGPFEMLLWAYGRFEVHSGLIVRQTEYIDWATTALAGLRAFVTIFVPPLRAGRRLEAK